MTTLRHTFQSYLTGLVLCFLLFAVSSHFGFTCFAADWPHWRGPYLNGSADWAGSPTAFQRCPTVLWACPLPGPSAATPIIHKDRLFVSSTDRQSNDLLALCIDARTGQLLWRRKLGTSSRKVPQNNMATSSPVADDERVFFLYGSGHLVALDHQGNVLWRRNLEAEYGNISLKFGYASSPLLYQNRLFVFIQRRDRAWRAPYSDKPLPSFLLAIDPATGKNLWLQPRRTDALDESLDSYASPIAFEHNGRAEILTIGGDYLICHDIRTGRELWRYNYAPVKSTRWRIVPSVLATGPLVIGIQPRGGNQLFAVKAGGEGLLDNASVAWTFQGATPDTSTPLLYRGLLYVFDGDRTKLLTCLDPNNGRQLWQGRIEGPGPWRASPTAAAGKIFCLSESGRLVAVAAGPDAFKVLWHIELGNGRVRASVAIAHGRLFVRTASKLLCLADPQTAGR